MNLLERSEKLAAVVVEINALAAIADRAEAIRSRATQFESALDELRLSAGSARHLRDRGVAVECELKAAGVRHFLSQLLGEVNADPAAILAAKDIHPKMLAPLAKIASILQEAADQAWRRHVRQQLPEVRGDLLDALTRVPALRSKVERFRVLRERALAGSERTPTTDAEFNAVELLVKHCNQAWRELDSEGIPKEVLIFLREAATPRGASLSKLTPTIVSWLEANNLAEAFGVRIR